MPILNKLTGAFPATLFYITAGILIDVWSLMWFIYYPPDTRSEYFWIVGFLLTGLALLAIGLLLGRIGRAARVAELPPQEAVKDAAQVEKISASNGSQEPPSPEGQSPSPPKSAPPQPVVPAPSVAQSAPPPSVPPIQQTPPAAQVNRP